MLFHNGGQLHLSTSIMHWIMAIHSQVCKAFELLHPLSVQAESATADARAGASVQTGSTRASADVLPHNAWQGRNINFMRSNEHSRERDGTWNTDGLKGGAVQFVSGDENAAKCVAWT